jgi:hypothetical protein
MRRLDMTRGWVPLALAGAFGLSAGAGCGPQVPEEPTWEEDVRPILMANCVRCHGDPPLLPNIPAAVGFRLDVYDDDEENGVAGAATMSSAIYDQAAVQELMPPTYRLTSIDYEPVGRLTARQQEILRLWHEQGAPRGSPAPDGGTARADAGAEADAGGEANAD